jgi:hypothetical protein
MLNCVSAKFRTIKNKFLLKLGFTMFNQIGGVTVFLQDGKQIKSNPFRVNDYSMDDVGWVIANQRQNIAAQMIYLFPLQSKRCQNRLKKDAAKFRKTWRKQ